MFPTSAGRWKERVRLAVAATLLGGVVGCDATSPELPNIRGGDVVVVALATEREVTAVVAEFSGAQSRFVPRTDLVLRAESQGEEISLARVGDSICNSFRASEFACFGGLWVHGTIGPGDTVALNGAGSEGLFVRGQTVLPTRLHATIDGDSVASLVLGAPFNLGLVAVDASPGVAHLVQVRAQRATAHQGDRDVECSGALGTLSVPVAAMKRYYMTLGRPSCADTTAPVDSFSIYLSLMSFDSSYAAYWAATQERGIPIEAASFGLDGVSGVFGSVVLGRPVRVALKGGT